MRSRPRQRVVSYLSVYRHRGAIDRMTVQAIVLADGCGCQEIYKYEQKYLYFNMNIWIFTVYLIYIYINVFINVSILPAVVVVACCSLLLLLLVAPSSFIPVWLEHLLLLLSSSWYVVVFVVVGGGVGYDNVQYYVAGWPNFGLLQVLSTRLQKLPGVLKKCSLRI